MIKKEPRSAFAYYQRGSFYVLSGDKARGMKDFDSAMQANSLFRDRVYAGEVSFGTNLLPDYLSRAIEHYKMKKYKEAFDDVMVVLSIDPQNAEAYYYRGLLYEKANVNQKALLDYKTAVQIDPSHQEAKRRLSRL